MPRDPVAATTSWQLAPPAHIVAILYRVVDISGELRVEQGGSTDACAWLSAGELVDLAHVPLVERALDALATEP